MNAAKQAPEHQQTLNEKCQEIIRNTAIQAPIVNAAMHAPEQICK